MMCPGHGTLRHNINSGQGEPSTGSRFLRAETRDSTGHCHGHPGPGAQSWGRSPPDNMMAVNWCLYRDQLQEREKDRNCWERHCNGARTHSSCIEWVPVWAEKLWQRSGVRTFPAETLRLMTPTLREESWGVSSAGCDVWSDWACVS